MCKGTNELTRNKTYVECSYFQGPAPSWDFKLYSIIIFVSISLTFFTCVNRVKMVVSSSCQSLSPQWLFPKLNQTWHIPVEAFFTITVSYPYCGVHDHQTIWFEQLCCVPAYGPSQSGNKAFFTSPSSRDVIYPI